MRGNCFRQRKPSIGQCMPIAEHDDPSGLQHTRYFTERVRQTCCIALNGLWVFTASDETLKQHLLYAVVGRYDVELAQPWKEELRQFRVSDVVEVWRVCQHEIDGGVIEERQVSCRTTFHNRRAFSANRRNRPKAPFKDRLLRKTRIFSSSHQLPYRVRE